MTRHCSRCRLDLPIDAFCVNRSRKDGRQLSCKRCESTRVAAYTRRHAAAVKARRAAFRAANREKLRQQKAASYLRNKATVLAEQARRRKLIPPDRARDYFADYYRRNKARISKRAAAYRRRPAVMATAAARERQRRRDDPSAESAKRRRPVRKIKIRGYNAVRRARKRTTTTEPVDYAAIMRRDRMICHICRRRVAEKNLHFDHVVPLARGGAHVAENIAVAHERCNLKKGATVTNLF